ncbi:DUF2683 family protein [Parapedobacter tibetensis]|uniref:DUF2683 family protein n=1 Tax=Parapedobacter tibetensis TaxID=2972951 RepID=UPI00214DD0A1|nr:DUF2683 family protein [Parapedobacter tibetensis]
MKTLIVQPQNAEQLNAVEAVLRLLKISFIKEDDELPAHVIKGATASLQEAAEGQLSPFTTINDMIDAE